MSSLIERLKSSPFLLAGIGLAVVVAVVLIFTSGENAERVALINQDTALGDRVLGDPNAEVTVIEYYSSTCPHCARFHEREWPEFEEKYVKTNKIKFVMRPFFLNNLDAAAMAMTHCVANDKYYNVVDELLKTQSIWARSQLPRDELQKIAARHGLDVQGFEACLRNGALAENISNVKVEGQNLGVTGTPSFFVNGVRYSGNSTAAALGAAVDAQLAN